MSIWPQGWNIQAVLTEMSVMFFVEVTYYLTGSPLCMHMYCTSRLTEQALVETTEQHFSHCNSLTGFPRHMLLMSQIESCFRYLGRSAVFKHENFTGAVWSDRLMHMNNTSMYCPTDLWAALNHVNRIYLIWLQATSAFIWSTGWSLFHSEDIFIATQIGWALKNVQLL